MKAGMECLRLLFISGLFSYVMTVRIQTTDDCVSTPIDYYLSNNVHCRHYNIKIVKPSISYFGDNYWLEISYYIDIKDITRHISLHYNPQSQIDELGTSLRADTRYTISQYAIQYIYCSTTQILKIYFEMDVLPGKYILNMKVRNALTAPDIPGFSKITYFDRDGNQMALFLTNFAWNARTVFPCWDEPSLNATFNISVRHPRSYKALSNMPIRERQDDTLDSVWTHFQTTPPMPTYVVAIVIFNDFSAISNQNNSINVWGRQKMLGQLIVMFDIAEQVSNYILNVINLKDQMPKLDHVVIPTSSLLSQKNWGLCFYKETDYDTFIAYYVTKKMAYHWFSIVSPNLWYFTWMNEGIVSFLGLYITDKLFKHLRIMDNFVVKEQQVAMSKDVQSHLHAILHDIYSPEEIEQTFSGPSIKKATALIRMLYSIIPKETFRLGIRSYIQACQHVSGSIYDLWTAFRTILVISNKLDFIFGETSWYSGSWMMSWLVTSNYPMVHAQYIHTSNAIKIIEKHIYVPEINNLTLWWVPVTCTTQANPNFNKSFPIYWLHIYNSIKYINNITNVPNGWIICNLQQTGYYRVNYDMENWQSLINYLNNDNYTKIHPINRAQLIDDSYHLMLTDHLDSSVFLNISTYLKRDLDYIPWYSMNQILSEMWIFFRFPEGASIREHMATILYDVINKIQFKNIYSPTSYHIRELSVLVVELACKFGNHQCLTWANSDLNSFLKDTKEHKILSGWKKWTFCRGIETSLVDKWLQMLNEYKRTKDIDYLESLNCIEKPLIIILYINMLMLNQIPIEDNYRSEIMQNIIVKHAAKDRVLQYFITNYDWIRTSMSVPLIEVLINNVYQLEQFQELKEFIEIHKFSEEEMQTHENFKEYLLSSLETRSDQIQAVLKMFIDIFKIKKKKTTSSQAVIDMFTNIFQYV